MKENKEMASSDNSFQKDNSLLRFITKYFVEGLFVLLPLTITIVVLIWLTDIFMRQLGPQTVIGGYLKTLGIRIAGDSPVAYIIGWAIVLCAIVLLGFIVDRGSRKYIKQSIDLIMKRIPIINKLYKVSAQIVDMVNKNEQAEFKGMSVVYCSFGGEKGALFLALMPTPQVYTINNVQYNVILIPSAPIPVGGSMMLVPVSSVEPAEISIEEFTQIYISMGSSSGDILPKSDNAESTKHESAE